MRAIVTGAAGFIGSTLVDRLIGSGHEVFGLDNLSTGRVENLHNALDTDGRFALKKLEVQSPELRAYFTEIEPDVVFHLAAQVDLRASVADPRHDAVSNILGTINLCEASRQTGVQRVVYAASGGSRYGAPTVLPVRETDALAPLSPYAVSKLAGELYLGAYAGMYGIAPICLALSNVYGPRQNPMGEAGVIAKFGAAVIGHRQATIFGDGTSARDYVYVDDVVDAFVRAADAPLSVTGTFNIGTGSQTTVADVYRLICSAVGSREPASYGPAHIGELHAIALDPQRAMQELGWKPTVDITEGINRTIAWLQMVLAEQELKPESARADLG